MGLLIVVKLLYGQVQDLTAANADLTSQNTKYQALLDDVVKDEEMKKKIRNEVTGNTTYITDSFNDLKKQVNDLLYENMNNCDDETEAPVNPGTVNRPTNPTPKNKEIVKKVSDLIGGAWCTLDKQREGCIQ